MRLLTMALFALCFGSPVASAQSGADIVRGIIGGVASEIIQQQLKGGGAGGSSGGGQTMFGMTCPGQWVNNGQGHMCRCPNGQWGNLVGGQVVCPGGQQQSAPRASQPQLTDAQRQEQAEQERLRKEYAQERRKCLDKSDLEACQQALTYPQASAKDREALVSKVNAVEARQKLALEKEMKARALEEEKRQVALAQQRAVEEAAARKQQLAGIAADAIKQRIAQATTQALTAPSGQPAANPGPYVGSDVRLPDAPQTPDSTGPLAMQVRDKLKKEVEHLAAQGFRPTLAETVREIGKDQPTSMRVGLTEGTEYAFVAACAECSMVELILLDAHRVELTRSPAEQADAVILNGSAPATADFEIATGVPGCAAERCYGGMIVLRKGSIAAAPSMQTAAIPSATAAAAPPPIIGSVERAKFVQNELNRVGCYQGEIDGNWGTKSIAALAEFAKHAKVAIQADEPSEALAGVVAAHSDRVCPPLATPSKGKVTAADQTNTNHSNRELPATACDPKPNESYGAIRRRWRRC